MEIPAELKTLYRHWKYHTQKPSFKTFAKNIDCRILDEIMAFAKERMFIWEKKEFRKEKPYTKNPILQRYRFCNVYRELDKQTIELHTTLKGIRKNFDLFLLNTLFFRLICNPNTFRKVGLLLF